MSTHDSTEVEGTDSVKPRLRRALTEYHTVINEGGDTYSVTSQSGREYTVDADVGRCTCPDAEYNLASDDLCKHALRVAVVRGERVIPATIDRDEVDPQLGVAVETTPVAVATDGGTATTTDTVTMSEEDHPRERPVDCGCWDPDGDLPCWPCYRDGFETPNPDSDSAGD
jgi:hypothetical protein